VTRDRSIGLDKIDEAFEKLALTRLRAANEIQPMGIDLEDAAWFMMKSREFQNAKCDFGGRDNTPVFIVSVPGLLPTYANEIFGIGHWGMKFLQKDLQALFDVQVDLLCAVIDDQIARFRSGYPGATISHMLLSNGICNIEHVINHLSARYGSRAGPVHVTVVSEPQITVAKGLVSSRLRELRF